MELSERKQKILKAIVDLYIRSAEPVGSKTIAALPELMELNIGYYMIGEALFVGLAETVRRMRAAMDRGRSRA